MPVQTGAAQFPGDPKEALASLCTRFLHLESLLSLPGFVLSFLSGAQTGLADSTSYYWGGFPALGVSTTAGSRRIYVPRRSIVRSAFGMICLAGPGSNESVSLYLRHNNSVDYLLATVSLDVGVVEFSNTALRISCQAGDYLEMKMVTPVFATDPTLTFGSTCQAFLENT